MGKRTAIKAVARRCRMNVIEVRRDTYIIAFILFELISPIDRTIYCLEIPV